MRYVNGAIGGIFLILTALYVGQGNAFHLSCFAMLSLATLLAFLTFVPALPDALSRVLAVATVATMFYFFAGFSPWPPALTESGIGPPQRSRRLRF